MKTLESALGYASSGWRVHPLRPGDKRPLLEGWQHRATTEEGEIRAWWAHWPDANIGIATGRASGIWVLDVDVGSAHARSGGAESLARLQERCGPLGDTYTVHTAGGGYHLYFMWPDAGTVRKRAVPGYSGLDSIGEGGYVVAPPSTVGDRSYTHSPFEAEASPTPAALLEIIQSEPVSERPVTPPTAQAHTHYDRPELEEARSALTALSADCSRDEWRDIGMALHSEWPDEGFDLWRDWSASAPGRYPGEDELRRQWQSYRGEGIHIATLFARARAAGWRPPSPVDEILAMRGVVSAPRSEPGPGPDPTPTTEPAPADSEEDLQRQHHTERVRALLVGLADLDPVARAEALLAPAAITWAAALRVRYPDLYSALRKCAKTHVSPVATFDRAVLAAERRLSPSQTGPVQPRLSNYVGTGDEISPRPLAEISAEIVPALGQCGGRLFVRRSDGGATRWLAESTDLSAWARRHYLVDWSGCGPSWAELHSDLLCECEDLEAVLDVPHSPPIASVWYSRTLPVVTWPKFARLNAFLALFNPATLRDGELIMAAIATGMWGGPPATRPAFCFSSDFGRGVGKSATAHAISMLYGYPLSIDNPRDERLVSRILGYDGRTVIVDNIKGKFDSAMIESLITTPVINGHRMHVGQSKCMNYFTFLLTANTPELSADLAQRSIPIKIGRERHGEDFVGAVAALLAGEGRWEILADVAEWLRGPVLGVPAPDRWSSWQRAVLARCAEPAELQRLILSRRGAADGDAEEARAIYDAVWERARLSGGADSRGRYALSPSEMVQALRPVLGDRAATETQVAAIYERHRATLPISLIERCRGGRRGRAYWIAPLSTGAETETEEDPPPTTRDERLVKPRIH